MKMKFMAFFRDSIIGNFLALTAIIISSATSNADYEKDSSLKIIGGELASPGEFPYQVFIEKIWNSTKIYKCGGAILNRSFIITAAHCLFFREFGGELAKPRKIWVTAGTHDLITQDPEIRKFEQVSRASELFPHPLFRFENAIFNSTTTDLQKQYPIHDIALIRLNKPLNFTERVQPIKIPTDSYFPLIGNGTVTGYGRKQWEGRWTRTLRKVSIPLVEWEQCKNVFNGVANVTKNMFCTGTKDGGLTPCNGDSGGVVTCDSILCGVISFGAWDCSNWSVYTRVSSYLEFIRMIIDDKSS